MKVILYAILIMSIVSSYSFAGETKKDDSLSQVRKESEEKQPEHLLDGTSMNYYYQNGGGIHIEFYNGLLNNQRQLFFLFNDN